MEEALEKMRKNYVKFNQAESNKDGPNVKKL